MFRYIIRLLGGFKAKMIEKIIKEGSDRLENELDYVEVVKILRKLKCIAKQSNNENNIEITDENIVIDISD